MEVKERATTRKSEESHIHFLADMRFWLIVLMLAAFVGYLIFLSPS